MRVNTGPGRVETRTLPAACSQRRVSGLLFNFDIDDASLKPDHQQWLDSNVVPFLPTATRIALSGTASRSGSDQYNLALSQRRVKTIKDYLLGKGAKPAVVVDAASGELLASAAGQVDGSEDARFRAVDVTLEAPIVPVFKARVHPIDGNTRAVPSMLGARGKDHFVAAKNLSGVFLIASPSDPACASLDVHWEAVDEAGNVIPAAPGIGGPLSVKLPSDVSRKIALRLVSNAGTSLYEAFVWIVFATITGKPETDEIISDASGLGIGLAFSFTHTITPPSIISLTADVPNLAGPKATPLPEGTNHAGKSLQTGADRKWDTTRKIRKKFVNPSSISLASIGGNPSFHTTFPNFPTTADGDGHPGGAGAMDADLVDVVGNDDSSTGDEDNDPYTAPDLRKLIGFDQPSRSISHTVGSDGDTVEWRLHFLEFARVEISGKWFRISDHFPWRVHIKMKRVAGKWIDNGSVKEFNNNGF